MFKHIRSLSLTFATILFFLHIFSFILCGLVLLRLDLDKKYNRNLAGFLVQNIGSHVLLYELFC